MEDEQIKKTRNISGIYFRFHNPDTLIWENRVFEDLPETEQDRILADKNIDFCKSLCKLLANTIYELADRLDIEKNNHYEE